MECWRGMSWAEDMAILWKQYLYSLFNSLLKYVLYIVFVCVQHSRSNQLEVSEYFKTDNILKRWTDKLVKTSNFFSCNLNYELIWFQSGDYSHNFSTKMFFLIKNQSDFSQQKIWLVLKTMTNFCNPINQHFLLTFNSFSNTNSVMHTFAVGENEVQKACPKW